jgi:hypothetical protein
MLEALEYYQSLAQRFQSQLLTGPGIAIVLVGLCIWLAGLRWRRILGAVAGTAIAAVAVLNFGDYPSPIVWGACAVGLIAGVIVNRLVLSVFGTIIGVIVVMIFLSGSLQAANYGEGIKIFDANHIYNPDHIKADDFVSEYPYPTWRQYEQGGVVIPAPDAIKITAAMAGYFIGRAKRAVFSAGAVVYGGAAIAAVVIVFFSLITPRLFIAAVSAIIGSAVIFAGMIILLFYKGSEPISLITARAQFYGLVFGAMTAFGIIVQLLLSPSLSATIIRADDSKKDNGE